MKRQTLNIPVPVVVLSEEERLYLQAETGPNEIISEILSLNDLHKMSGAFDDDTKAEKIRRDAVLLLEAM